MTTPAFTALQDRIAALWRDSPFYRRHWRDAGVADGWVPGSPEALDRLPVVTKADILSAQTADPPWGGLLGVAETAVAQLHLTSGTSGLARERFAVTAADVDLMGRSWFPQFEAIGLRPGDVAVYTVPLSLMSAGLSAFEGARLYGLVPLFTGVAGKAAILDLITRHEAAYLYGTESFLMQLAHAAAEAGLAGAWRGHLKGVQSVGSSPALLAAAEAVFGAPVYEIFGCTQAVAKIGTTCAPGAAAGHVHLRDEHLVIETRDPATGAWTESGPATVILSTPFREACPMIRYDLRDQVDLVPPGSCACGASGRAFRPGSVTRTDSMVKIRGMNVWPQAVERLILGRGDIRDFRAEVRRRAGDGADELILRIAPRDAATDPDGLATELAGQVREATLVRPTVVVDADIPDAAGEYKVRRWRDARQAAPDDS